MCLKEVGQVGMTWCWRAGMRVSGRELWSTAAPAWVYSLCLCYTVLLVFNKWSQVRLESNILMADNGKLLKGRVTNYFCYHRQFFFFLKTGHHSANSKTTHADIFAYPILLTRQNPSSHSGCYGGFPLADVGQEGEEQAISCHGKDDTRQGEHGTQQTGGEVNNRMRWQAWVQGTGGLGVGIGKGQ